MAYFSVVIPSFNRAGLIGQTLDSVLAQEFTDHEVIVVDDGSTDGTLDVLDRYAGRIRVIEQPNGGPGAARNRGVEQATGKYVAFLDSDDLWFPWSLATYREVIDRCGAPSIVTGTHMDFTDERDLATIHRCPPRFHHYADFLASPRSWIIPSAVVLTPETHRQAGGFRTDIWICEDGDYWLRVGCAPGFVRTAAPATVGYRLHPGGISQAWLGRVKGVHSLLDAERAGAYPGGAARKRERMDYICTHMRPTSLGCLRSGLFSAGFGLYGRTLPWNLRLGRVRYAGGFPLMAAAQFARRLGQRCRAVVRRATWDRPPTEVASLRAIASAAGGRVTVRRAPRMQSYRLPEGLAADVAEFFGRFQSMAMPEEVRCTVPGGRVVGPGVVLSPDGRSVARDVSVVFGGTPDDHPLLHADRIPPARRLRGRTLAIASAGGESYYHWLFDELPRLIEADGERYDAVIGHRGHLDRIARMTGFTGRIIEVNGPCHYHCDELSVASLFGISGHPTPEAAAALREFAARHGLRPAQGRRRRIFVSRSAARLRRLVHEPDIWPRLEARGFERLFLERMSWEEQIAAFTAAEIVVAPHGAGLANLVFCEPGTRLIELFDRRYLHWCYWQLAAVSGLEYRAVVSDGHAPPNHDFAHMATDIDVRWDRLSPLA